MEYDIVVVGGGPAGASAAKTAAEKGLNVLLTEKRGTVGYPVRCGEGLSNNVCGEFGIKPKSYFHQTDYFDFLSTEDKVIRFNSKNYVVDRSLFDQDLVKSAEDVGAEVWLSSRVEGLIQKNGVFEKVKIKRGNKNVEVHAKAIIAADGVESEVGRMAGVDTSLKLDGIGRAAAAVVTDVSVEKNIMKEYFLKEALGYMWIFPKSESVANIGVGIIDSVKNVNPLKLLNNYMSSIEGLQGGKVDHYTSGGVPMNRMLEKLVHKNILFVGDAARLSNPIGGDGIHQAMRSGKLAALTAAESIEKDDPNILTNYDPRLKNTEIGKTRFLDVQYEFYTVQRMLLSLQANARSALIEELWESAMKENSYPFSMSNVMKHRSTKLGIFKIIVQDKRLRDWAIKRRFSMRY